MGVDLTDGSTREKDDSGSKSVLEAEFDLCNRSHPHHNGIHGNDVEKSLAHIEVMSPSMSSLEGDVQVRHGCIARFIPTAFLPELKQTLRIAWPLIIIQFSSFWMQPIVSVFVGHLGKKELDAIALANSMINVLGLAVVFGLASMCDTYFSQTHGAKNNKLNGLFLQRAILIHLLSLLPLLAVHLNMETILAAIGEDPEISRLSGVYLTYFLPGFFFMFLHVVFRKFTYCQNVIYPNLIVSATSLPLHALLQYLLVYAAGLGIIGSAIGEALIYFYMMATTIAYVYFSGMLKDCWTGWSWSCLEEWGPMVSLGLFGMFMIVLELFAFEVVTILSGLLGDTQLGAQTIMFNVDLMMYGLPSGIALAASVRVGWHLGANEPLAAKTAASSGIFITMITSFTFCILLYIFHNDIPKVFSSDDEVIALAATLIPFICTFMFPDHISAVCRSVYRTTGKTVIGATVIFITYYIFALPVGIPLMFCTDMELSGLWLTLTVVLICNAFVYVAIIFFRFDWTELAEEASKRTRSNKRQSLIEDASTETTPLLLRSDRTSTSEVVQPVGRQVFIRRGITVIIMVTILIVGVILRMTVKMNNIDMGDDLSEENITLPVQWDEGTTMGQIYSKWDNVTHMWDYSIFSIRPMLYPKS